MGSDSKYDSEIRRIYDQLTELRAELDVLKDYIREVERQLDNYMPRN